MLRGMPGRALEEVVARLRAVVDTDHALELRRRSALEPAADPGAHERTVARDRRAVAQVGRRPLPEPSLGELAQVHPVHEAERQPEDVVGEVAERAVTLRGSPVEQGLRDDADESLRTVEDPVQTLRELGGWKLPGGGIRDADERGVRGRVPAVDDAVADRHGRHPRHPEARQLGERVGLRLHVHRVELDPPRREELLRLGARRSAGTIVEPGTAHALTSRGRSPASCSRRPSRHP